MDGRRNQPLARHGTKSDLSKLVQRQISKWPRQKKFQPTKATIPQIKAVRLDPTNGFTTNKPPVASPHPAKTGCGRNSGTSVVRHTITTRLLQTPGSSVRISFPDPEDEVWKIPFVRVHHGQVVDEIPENGRIRLFVHNLGLAENLGVGIAGRRTAINIGGTAGTIRRSLYKHLTRRSF
ncbi:hypothetical protein B0H13DRAFT_1850648 [Mycena leptocephala]|nr:hypothetical protein B0H13DRAFT_1850648 [Mycena leptocephala]